VREVSLSESCQPADIRKRTSKRRAGLVGRSNHIWRQVLEAPSRSTASSKPTLPECQPADTTRTGIPHAQCPGLAYIGPSTMAQRPGLAHIGPYVISADTSCRAALAAAVLAQLRIETRILLRPEGAMQAQPQQLAREALRHLLSLLGRAGVGSCPHRPQE
jgi:hypothetical protein